MPRRANACESNGTVARDSAVSATRRIGLRRALSNGGGHEVAGARQPREGLASPAACQCELVDLGEDAPGGRARQVGPPGRRGGGAQCGSVLGTGGKLGAGHVVGALDGQAAGLQDLTQWAAQVGVAGRHHHGGAHLDRLARVRGSPEAGDGARRHALGHIRGRRGSERRHQALRGDEHRAAFPDACADLADCGGQGAAGHGHHDKVDARELDLGHRLWLDRLVEPDTG